MDIGRTGSNMLACVHHCKNTNLGRQLSPAFPRGEGALWGRVSTAALGRITFAGMGGTGWLLPIPQFQFHQQMLSSDLACPASLVVIAFRCRPSPEPFSSLLLIGLSLIGKGLPPLHHGLWQLAWIPFLSGWAGAEDFSLQVVWRNHLGTWRVGFAGKLVGACRGT